MNNLAMSGRKSSHEAEVGRHEIFCYTESEASMTGTGSVGATGLSGGGISSGVGGTMTEATKDRMSSGKGGTVGSPYFFQRAIHISCG